MVVVGRIVAASLQSFEISCFSTDVAPPLGALLVTMDSEPPIYGAVSAVSTQGVDPSRPIAPHGGADEDLATVVGRNPQLSILLRTTATAIVVGFGRLASVRQTMPDLPPPLIARVRLCSYAELSQFVGRLDCLRLLLNAGEMADFVTSAFLVRAGRASADPRGFRVRAGQALVPLLGSQAQRLSGVLRELQEEV